MDPDDIVSDAADGQPGSADVTYVSLNKPIWFYGLKAPHWLLPERNDNAESIAFVAIACEQANVGPQPEDDRGRFARGSALYMSESFWFRTSLKPIAVVPVVRGSGPSMMDREMTAEEISDLGAQGIRYVVTSLLSEDGLVCKIAMTVHDTSGKRPAERFAKSGQRFAWGSMVSEIEENIRDYVDPSGSAHPWYEAPQLTHIDGYIGSLARALTLFLAEKRVLPKDQVVGEPNVLQWIADFAGSAENLPTPLLMLMAGIATDRGMGSDTYRSFQNQTLGLVNRIKAPEHPAFRLAPFVFKTFGQEDAYAERCGTLLEIGDSPLISWLEVLENLPA